MPDKMSWYSHVQQQRTDHELDHLKAFGVSIFVPLF